MHCSLACRYCLSESKLDTARRILSKKSIIAAADEAVALGFTAFGLTGGEPFTLPAMPGILRNLATRIPTVVLTNGSLFTDQLLAELRPLGVEYNADHLAVPAVDLKAVRTPARVRS